MNTLYSYLIDEDPTVVLAVLLCQHVDVEGGLLGPQPVARTSWTAKVPCMNNTKEPVGSFNLDCHDASPAGGAHARGEDLLRGGQGRRDGVVVYLTRYRQEQSLETEQGVTHCKKYLG